MKKFKKEEILHNTIKAYPKVEIYLNAGKLFLDRQNYYDGASQIPYGFVGLNETINPIITYNGFSIPLSNGIVLENGVDFLLAEDNSLLIQET